MNQTFLQGLGIKLDEAKGKWMEELSRILWAYQVTPRVLTNESHFNLAFDIEVVIPIEIGLLTIRIEHYDKSSNSTRLKANLHLLEVIQNQAHLRMMMH